MIPIGLGDNVKVGLRILFAVGAGSVGATVIAGMGLPLMFLLPDAVWISVVVVPMVFGALYCMGFSYRWLSERGQGEN